MQVDVVCVNSKSVYIILLGSRMLKVRANAWELTTCWMVGADLRDGVKVGDGLIEEHLICLFILWLKIVSDGDTRDKR